MPGEPDTEKVAMISVFPFHASMQYIMIIHPLCRTTSSLTHRLWGIKGQNEEFYQVCLKYMHCDYCAISTSVIHWQNYSSGISLKASAHQAELNNISSTPSLHPLFMRLQWCCGITSNISLYFLTSACPPV